MLSLPSSFINNDRNKAPPSFDNSVIIAQQQQHNENKSSTYQYVDAEIDQDLICTLCESPFIDPVVHNSVGCGHLFCLLCAKNVSTNKCPVCKADEFNENCSSIMVPKYLTKNLDKLKVNCQMCKGVVERNQLKAHQEESCPVREAYQQVEKFKQYLTSIQEERCSVCGTKRGYLKSDENYCSHPKEESSIINPKKILASWEDYVVEMFAELTTGLSHAQPYMPELFHNPTIDRTSRASISKGLSRVKLNGVDVLEKVSFRDFYQDEIYKKINTYDGVVKLLHYYTDESDLVHLFLELMDTSLDRSKLENFGIGNFGILIQALFICMKCCETMKYLHEQKIIHYDIKPANILIKRIEINGLKLVKDVKIADFDISVTFDKVETYSATIVGTRQYMAPELYAKMNNKSTTKEYLLTALDVYSFGVTMYQLFSQRHVEHDERITHFLTKEELLELYPCLTDNQASQLVQVVYSCLGENPKSRPSFNELHKSLKEVTANILKNLKLERKREFISSAPQKQPIKPELYIINREAKETVYTSSTHKLLKVKLNGVEVLEKISTESTNENELDIFKKVSMCEGVVKFLHHVIDECDVVHLFLELMDSSLEKTTLTTFGDNTFGILIQILFICLKCCETMKYLHERKVIHYDIKPANILINMIEINGLKLVKDVKIADFDVSVFVDKVETYSASVGGTRQYMAPEIHDKLSLTYLKPSQKEYLLTALDIYSFGVTMYELFSQRHVEHDERITHFLTAEKLLELYPCLTPEQASKIERIGNSCLAEDPKSRPPFSELVQCLEEIAKPLFQSISNPKIKEMYSQLFSNTTSWEDVD